jgi:hypothetical protein
VAAEVAAAAAERDAERAARIEMESRLAAQAAAHEAAVRELEVALMSRSGSIGTPARGGGGGGGEDVGSPRGTPAAGEGEDSGDDWLTGFIRSSIPGKLKPEALAAYVNVFSDWNCVEMMTVMEDIDKTVVRVEQRAAVEVERAASNATVLRRPTYFPACPRAPRRGPSSSRTAR